MKFVIVLIAVLVAICAADRSAIIIRDSRPPSNKIGNYEFEFETSNGIQREEVGEVKEYPDNRRATVVRGTASWTTPEGTPVELKFYADENGYHPMV